MSDDETTDNDEIIRPGRGELAHVDVSSLDEHGAARRFDYVDEFGREAVGVLINWRGELLAYRNRCPHWGTELDGGSGEFFDASGHVLMCQMHGARFEPDTGECRIGPCEGQSLEPLSVERDEGASHASIKKRRTLSI